MRGKKAEAKTVRISSETLDRLNKFKAPKQAYDGFIGQLLDLWEANLKRTGPAGGNRGAEGIGVANQLK